MVFKTATMQLLRRARRLILFRAHLCSEMRGRGTNKRGFEVMCQTLDRRTQHSPDRCKNRMFPRLFPRGGAGVVNRLSRLGNNVTGFMQARYS